MSISASEHAEEFSTRSWKLRGGRTLRPEVIGRWVKAVARRALSPAEQEALRITRFVGRSGVDALSIRGVQVSSSHPDGFEAAVWVVQVKEMTVIAFLGTPAQFVYRLPSDHQQDVLVFRILSGTLHIEQHDAERVMVTGDIGLVRPDESFLARTWGTFSAVIVILPLASFEAHDGLSEEVARLHAVIEVARACLVEQLGRQVRLDVDARVLRDLLVIPKPPISGAASQRALLVQQQARSLIEWEHTDPQFSVERIASALNLSRRHLYRCFVGAEDTVANLLLRRRLDTSIQLMESDPDLSLDLIALRSGFSSGDQFRRAFRRYYGMPPSTYRRQRLGDLNDLGGLGDAVAEASDVS